MNAEGEARGPRSQVRSGRGARSEFHLARLAATVGGVPPRPGNPLTVSVISSPVASHSAAILAEAWENDLSWDVYVQGAST
jgi:hypothetical protein